MKAIETVYKGYRFRSRLEARWAVFFDAMGIEWEYEVEGYERDGYYDENLGSNEILKYLPDFKLGPKSTNLYAEVKGDPNALKSNAQKFVNMHDFGGILPGFMDSCGTNNGLLLLGQIPEPKIRMGIFHPIIQHHKGLWRTWALFCKPTFRYPSGVAVIQEINVIEWLFGLTEEVPITGSYNEDGLDLTPLTLSTQYTMKTYDAYLAARQSRFEHGERHV